MEAPGKDDKKIKTTPALAGLHAISITFGLLIACQAAPKVLNQ
jgi:hypothetical protein